MNEVRLGGIVYAQQDDTSAYMVKRAEESCDFTPFFLPLLFILGYIALFTNQEK